MIDIVTSPELALSLLTLTVLEIVLGIDNLVFVSVLANRLPAAQRSAARKLGLLLALGTRLLLLFTLSWLSGLTEPLFHVWQHSVSIRDLILLAGGLFLLYKSTYEIHTALEGATEGSGMTPAHASFIGVCAQIMVLDMVFSLDSVITAVGLTHHFGVMALAIVLAVIVMLLASDAVSDFIERHPTIKMLAFSFLLLVGMMLVADGVGFHVPRGYVYFAILFSLFVEMLNLLVAQRKKGQ